MIKFGYFGAACIALLATGVAAETFNIPGGDMKSALDAYAKQASVQLIYTDDTVAGAHSKGAKGDLSAVDALARILAGSGLTVHRHSSGVIAVVRGDVRADDAPLVHEAATTAPTISGAALETVTVTSSKIGGDVQNIPISITAMSQEQLTQTQTAGGPDLVKTVPNLTFSKTNFSGYNLQIRGIGTQAVSVTTDPAVAVAFNDTAFIRNRFFEQEFYDVSQVEVLRGPQGTLYGRNATAGVVNLVSAKASDQYEAQASVDVGNYENRRLEGMLNIPVVSDKLDLRVAGEWTQREGYDLNLTTHDHVDGRDLWSGRATVSFKPFEKLHGDLIWEHFSENDNRSRTGKQLCTRDQGPTSIGDEQNIDPTTQGFMSQGCLPGSLYAPAAFGTPNGYAIPFVLAATFHSGTGDLGFIGYNLQPDGSLSPVPLINGDPYGNQMQSPNLREIASIKDPVYRAKNDTLELNFDYNLTPALIITSQTGYETDNYYSSQDFNRFNTVPVFNSTDGLVFGPGDPAWPVTPGGIYCDPQLGCSNSIVGYDISQARSQQISQEFLLQSSFDGPLNFNTGANYTHYRTIEDYYIFFNVITALTTLDSLVGNGGFGGGCTGPGRLPYGSPDANSNCIYVDPNPLGSINGQGHNYFRSDNPYTLNSYAGFGEAYYQIVPDLKLTAGLRYTDDNKTVTPVPSQILLSPGFILGGTVSKGYPVLPNINQHWGEFTGRFGGQWTPKVSFTDQTMVYGFYSRGYKGGGANPPGIGYSTAPSPFGPPIAEVLSYPQTFKPEFVNAFEVGSKNSLLDGDLTLNGDVFFYDYRNYQISQIIDRTAVNQNFNAHVWGSELEATWEPVPGLRFNFAGGYEGSRVGDNQFSLDLMNRLQGHTADYTILKPFLQLPSNCVILKTVVEQYIAINRASGDPDYEQLGALCPGSFANILRYGGINGGPPVTPDIVGNPDFPFNETVFPNQGQGFFANVGGNQLPNTPPFTLSLGAQYSMPLDSEWAATLRGDGYWQGNSFGRIYNDKPYDQIHGYTNLNLSLLFTNQEGWQAMAYVKNVFDTTAITGTFLNSDDSALTTNIFTTDPRLFGLRITKSW